MRETTRITKTMIAAALATGISLLAGCGSSGSPASAPAPSSAPTGAASGPATGPIRLGTPKGVDIPMEGRINQIGGAGFVEPAVGAAAPGAATPTAAVQEALSALTAGTSEQAFALLRRADRERYGSPAGWETSFANEPLPSSFTVTTVRQTSPEQAFVDADVAFSPSLDEVTGLVPARATLSVKAVRENGTWHLDWRNRSITAQFPSEDLITENVRAWAESRQAACGRGEYTNEYSGGLLGVAGFATALCTSPGAVTVEPTALTLDDLDDPQAVINAFGPSATDWARAIDITAPLPMRAVVAPLGDGWTVIGLLHINTPS